MDPPPKPERVGAIRAAITLPAAAPTSDPPTPTRLAGTGTAFEFDEGGEDRGDLIKFYNAVFVKKVKQFALRFSTSQNKNVSQSMPQTESGAFIWSFFIG
jgi:hypothetical protein